MTELSPTSVGAQPRERAALCAPPSSTAAGLPQWVVLGRLRRGNPGLARALVSVQT
jgi:hypothetical protein